METRQPPAPCTAHPLRSGATLRIRVQRGSTLFVRHGRVIFRTPPYWLADTMLAPCMHLDAEQAWEIAVAGWLEVTALAGTEILLITPQPRPGWLATAGSIAQRILRRIRPLPVDHGALER